MKNLFLLFISLICAGCLNAAAQDVITRKNGEDIKARIVEVTEDAIKYKRENLPDGPLFSISKSDVLMVTYQDGSRDVFVGEGAEEKAPAPGFPADMEESAEAGTIPPGLRPGMKYKELRKYYDYRDYYLFYGYEPYSPPVMGLCSFLVPGLGQMISGEVGRGLGFLGGSVACYAMCYASVAAGLSDPALVSMLVLVPYIALLAIDIAAIVDAVRVARVKNMYCSDLQQLSLDLDLTPYVDLACSGPNMAQPVAGFSLRMSF